MRILISGASGFIGSSLSLLLTHAGHLVVPLSRVAQSNGISWDPVARNAKESDFEGFDAVIHLAGEPLSIGRWGRKKRERIFSSRVDSTAFLVEILQKLQKPPKVFLSASAVGFYGDRGDEILTERSESGSSFLSHVCQEWERQSAPLEKLGIRVVHTRFGIVLDSAGGALQKLLSFYRIGLGAKLGDGKQWVSWIVLADLTCAIHHVLLKDELRGAVNMVAPLAIRQEELHQTLAHWLHRPAFLSIPRWFLRLVLGMSADELLLNSTRVLPEKLLESGFSFQFSSLDSETVNGFRFR